MKDPIAIAAAYYIALGKKNLEEVALYLHPNIQFTDPQEQGERQRGCFKGS